jgi:hypothetical protein
MSVVASGPLKWIVIKQKRQKGSMHLKKRPRRRPGPNQRRSFSRHGSSVGCRTGRSASMNRGANGNSQRFARASSGGVRSARRIGVNLRPRGSAYSPLGNATPHQVTSRHVTPSHITSDRVTPKKNFPKRSKDWAFSCVSRLKR